jgi:ABC-2 type transport system permease protein
MTNVAVDARPGHWRTRSADLTLLGWQVLYEQRSFWRNRARAFFAFMLPLTFLVIFGSLNSGDILAARGGIPADLFVIPGLLAYGVISATFTDIADGLAAARDTGILKRMRGTPLPEWAFLSGRIGSAVVTAAAVTVVTFAVGALAYDVHVRLETLPGLVLALLVGTACFSALGVAVNRLIPNAEAAPAVVNGLILPLTFISGVWADFDTPGWLQTLAELFPVQHLANSLQFAFDPRTNGPGIVLDDMLVLAVWGAIGFVVGARYLRREKLRD